METVDQQIKFSLYTLVPFFNPPLEKLTGHNPTEDISFCYDHCTIGRSCDDISLSKNIREELDKSACDNLLEKQNYI